VPAPAVIPAPKAYINAVAVKGFVVELGVDRVNEGALSHVEEFNHRTCNPRTSETNITGAFLPNFRKQCLQGDVRVHYCDKRRATQAVNRHELESMG
jgi:hypothetical protein